MTKSEFFRAVMDFGHRSIQRETKGTHDCIGHSEGQYCCLELGVVVEGLWEIAERHAEEVRDSAIAVRYGQTYKSGRASHDEID